MKHLIAAAITAAVANNHGFYDPETQYRTDNTTIEQGTLHLPYETPTWRLEAGGHSCFYREDQITIDDKVRVHDPLTDAVGLKNNYQTRESIIAGAAPKKAGVDYHSLLEECDRLAEKIGKAPYGTFSFGAPL